METRTRVVVFGALTLASGIAFGALNRRPHAPRTSPSAVSMETDEATDAPIAAAQDFDAPGSVDGSHREAPSLASAFAGLDDKPVRPPTPKNPETVTKLEAKYHDSSPAEMQLALDSLLEVLDAKINHRTGDAAESPASQLSSLYDEVGYLSGRCGH